MTTSANFISMSSSEFYPDPSDSVFDNLFRQYERTIIQSIITSFGLDLFIKDNIGGDVDTIHNVRNGIEYKNSDNRSAYENRGKYNSGDYHSNPSYIASNRKNSKLHKDGKLVDAYTGKSIAPNETYDQDHVISANEIHNDPGRVLSGLKGEDLANSPENLKATNPHTNRSKKADPMDKFLEKRGGKYTKAEKARMRKADQQARAQYNRKIAFEYYTSPAFWQDTGKAAVKLGGQMALRQTLGFVFTEVWFAVKHELAEAGSEFADKLQAIADGIKRGFENAKKKYKKLLSIFREGAVSGIISSLTTTLCNIFLTTAQNVVKIMVHPVRAYFAS